MIIVNEKYGVVLDPEKLRVGAAEPGFYVVSLSPIEEQLTALESAVDELFNTLDPTSSYKLAQPRREGLVSKAGFTTFFYLGVAFGVLAIALIFLALGGA
jgi:tetrahydromethanopterin S-methyltransferase subunit B